MTLSPQKHMPTYQQTAEYHVRTNRQASSATDPITVFYGLRYIRRIPTYRKKGYNHKI